MATRTLVLVLAVGLLMLLPEPAGAGGYGGTGAGGSGAGGSGAGAGGGGAGGGAGGGNNGDEPSGGFKIGGYGGPPSSSASIPVPSFKGGIPSAPGIDGNVAQLGQSGVTQSALAGSNTESTPSPERGYARTPKAREGETRAPWHSSRLGSGLGNPSRTQALRSTEK